MACNCHGKLGKALKSVPPTDQCTACAKKHVVTAWNLFNEFTYEQDNRDFISGQLRAAVLHLMHDHHDLALQVRDLAVIIEENRDAELTTQWDTVLAGVRQAYYADHPDALTRLETLANAADIR